MSAYVIASVVLAVYFFAQKKLAGKTFSAQYIGIASALTFAAVFFRDIVYPILVIPAILPVVAVVLSGNVAEFAEGLLKKVVAFAKGLVS